jgi:Mlc titration factor MtfA (ptsG expression regulator)
MLSLPIIAAAAIFVPSSIAARWAMRNARRRRLMAEDPPAEWPALFSQGSALYRWLPADLKPELHGHTRIFLAEKRFEGCGGLAITDEMKLIVAMQACVLLLRRKSAYFPKCDAILIYPAAYVAEDARRMGPVHMSEEVVRDGESWTQGVVVLAWDEVRREALNPAGGRNVVLHEFAHQLDQEDGVSDGTPPIGDRALYGDWVRVMSAEYEGLCRKEEAGRRDVLDYYGATNEAEFFAVATETFFCKSHQLRAERPGLYDLLKRYYRLDPAGWAAGG